MYYTELPKDCDKAVQGFVEKCKQEHIPVDMFNLSSGYSTGSDGLRYIFNWDKNRFPDVKGWFKSMKAQGVLVCPNVKPGMLITHANYSEFKDYFIQKEDGNPFVGYWWGGPGSYIDFTNEKAREKYAQMLKANYLDHNCETIWNDNNEYDQVDPNTICNNEGKPIPSQAVKTAQSLMMSYTTKQVLLRANRNQRPFVVSRSGSAGIQRYAQTWAGDNATSWASLKFNMATMLNSGLSGLINTGCDVGGFVGPRPNEELFVRWV
uniref:Glycoside hydrolase family 31 TIM barrel domain-containing protein n=1 Tax=Plectus sambesii TaxID=2011161 RepID=A0A914V119_9BILA